MKTNKIKTKDIEIKTNNNDYKLIELVNIFDYENIIIIIDGINKNDIIFDEIKSKKIEHFIVKKEGLYYQLIIQLSKNDNNILEKFILSKYDIFIFNNKNKITLKDYVNNDKINVNDLINQKNINFSIDYWKSEKKLYLYYIHQNNDYEKIIKIIDDLKK